MRKGRLKKTFALYLSMALVSMNCLNASALDYKKIFSKKNISVAAVTSAVIFGSYFLYNHLKSPNTKKPQDIKKNEEKNRVDILKLKDGGSTKKVAVFRVVKLNQQGKEINENISATPFKVIEPISDTEKTKIVKSEDITDLRVTKEGKDKKLVSFTFSNGKKVSSDNFRQSENIRQDRETGMFYLKIDDKLYELGKIVKYNGKTRTFDDYFFVCSNTGSIWDNDDINDIKISYEDNDDILYQGDSWKVFLYMGVFRGKF